MCSSCPPPPLLFHRSFSLELGVGVGVAASLAFVQKVYTDCQRLRGPSDNLVTLLFRDRQQLVATIVHHLKLKSQVRDFTSWGRPECRPVSSNMNPRRSLLHVFATINNQQCVTRFQRDTLEMVCRSTYSHTIALNCSVFVVAFGRQAQPSAHKSPFTAGKNGKVACFFWFPW